MRTVEEMTYQQQIEYIKKYVHDTGVRGVFYIPALDTYCATILLDQDNDTPITGPIWYVLSEAIYAFNKKECGSYYPFKVNGVSDYCNTFDNLLGYAIYDYQTFEPEGEKFYSPNELKIISEVIRYQKTMNAELEQLKAKRIGLAEVEQYSHTKIKSILNKKVRKNRGIFYVPALNGYTSTHCYDHFEKQKGNRVGAGCNYRKLRKFGPLCEIIPTTLRYFDNSVVQFCYPYEVHGKKGSFKTIEDIYKLVLQYPVGLRLIRDRYYYSRQAKRNLKYLIEYQKATLEDTAP